MKILAIGDIFGKPGRRIIKKYLPELKEKHQIDFVVANVENATHGKGISEKHYDKLKFADTEKKKILIDVMTSGTHTHVQTADERKLLKGTAFITDLGMTGPTEGVIGAKPEAIFRRAKYGFPAKIEPHEDEEHEGQFNGVIFEFDDNNKIISIKR